MSLRSALLSNRFLGRLIRVLDWHRLGRYLPWAVLLVSLAFTYRLWHRGEMIALQELQGDFASDFRATVSNIEQRMDAYEQMLRGLQGLFSASATVDRERFYSYVSVLQLEQNFPGVQGMGFSLIVQPSQKESHVESVRKEGLPEYEIQPTGQRKIYAPGIFVEPFSEANIHSLGIDNYADPIRHAGMDLARDTDEPVNSGKVLLQETDGHMRAGFLMFLPIYRNGLPHQTVEQRRANIIGWVYASSRMEAMMQGILGESRKNMDIEVHDGSDISEESLLYDSDFSHSHLVNVSQARFRGEQQIAIANHVWTVAAHSLPSFDNQLENVTSRTVYISFITSVLLSLLTGLLVYGRARALEDASEISQREARYRQMFEENPSIAYLLDPNTGQIVDANAAAVEFWGYSLEELRSMNIAKISFVPSNKIVEVMGIIKRGTTHRIEMQHRTRSGEIRFVEVFSGPFTYQGRNLRYSIAHDITARKQAEEGQLLATAVFNTVEDAVMVTDPENKIVMVNPSFTTITGYSAEEAKGKDPSMLASGRHPPEFFRRMWAALASSGKWSGEIWDRRKNGEIYLKWLAIKTVFDEGGKLTHYVAVFSELASHKGERSDAMEGRARRHE
ncbi:MAG: CHASE domain-containing protein [Gallionellaceae bacterium]